MAKKNLRFELNPLFSGPTLEARSKTGNPYRELSIAEIDVDPEQPRRVFDTDSLGELAESIKEHGVLCPILVKLLPGGSYRLVSGERRLRAAKLAGLAVIPAVVDSEEDESKTLPKQLVENLQRQDLTSMERALAIGALRERYSWSVREIAEKLGVSKGFVQRSLEVLQLPDDLKVALMAGASESKVLLLAKLESESDRREILKTLEDLNRSQLEEKIRRLNEPTRTKRTAYHGGTAESKLSTSDRQIVDDLKRCLGTKVSILRAKDSARGKLVIEFYSDDDLGELYRRIGS